MEQIIFFSCVFYFLAQLLVVLLVLTRLLPSPTLNFYFKGLGLALTL